MGDFVADAGHDDAALATMGEVWVFGESVAEEIQPDIVAEGEADEEVFVEMVFGLQHRAEAHVEVEDAEFTDGQAAVGYLNGGGSDGLVGFAGDAVEESRIDAGGSLYLEEVGNTIGER